MKKTLSIEYDELGYDELSPLEAELARLAREATQRSYAPYSKFHVGAAIALDNDEIVTAANQENAAFPSGTCAERTAAYYAHATHPQARFKAIALAARTPDGEFQREPVSPCGACRQALMEYEHLACDNVPVLLCGAEKVYRLPSVASTLPFAFVEF